MADAEFTIGAKDATAAAFLSVEKNLDKFSRKAAESSNKLAGVANFLGQNAGAFQGLGKAADIATVGIGSLAGSMSLFGGPAGIAIVAAGAIASFAFSANDASAKTVDLTGKVERLVGGMERLRLSEAHKDLAEARRQAAALEELVPKVNISAMTNAQRELAYKLESARVAVRALQDEEQNALKAYLNPEDKTAAGSSKRGAPAAEQEHAKAAEKFAALQASYYTEEQALGAHVARNLEIIQTAEDQRIGTDAERATARAQVLDEYHKSVEKMERDHQARKNAEVYKGLATHEAFAKAFKQRDLKNTLSFGTQMLSGVSSQNRSLFEAHKAFSLAQATVALPSAVMQSFEKGGGYPWGLIPAGLMLAQGLSLIGEIASSSYGGGSSASAGSVGGGSAASAVPTAPPVPASQAALPQEAAAPRRDVIVSLGDDDGLMTKSAVRKFMQAIAEEVGDGAKLVIA